MKTISVKSQRRIDIACPLAWTMAVTSLIYSPHTFAFSKLKNGFETITSTYLIPLAGAVAGASFIMFVTLSFFKQDEYQKKAANVAILSIFAGSGLELIRNLIQSFS
ncbi:hypothetical protein [Halobacteriovorax sp. RZ-2]|uniref:hypothetical protein n=1 Tax=unclassified Halobacteriovorax TaxID=2639665 RepID=UPI0037249C2D